MLCELWDSSIFGTVGNNFILKKNKNKIKYNFFLINLCLQVCFFPSSGKKDPN